MSEFDILKEKILNYFPPVDIHKINTYDNLIYEETVQSYEKYFAIIPLKHLINEEVYAPEIIKTLQTLRILLRSNLDNNRFIYELNLLVSAWGKGGYYKKSILKQELVELITKINKLFIHNQLEKLKHEEELMKYAEIISVDYNLQHEFEKVTLLPKTKKNISPSIVKNNKQKRSKKKIPTFNDVDLFNLTIKD